MTPIVKKFETRRRCIISASTGQFLTIYGDAVHAILNDKPQPPGTKIWLEFRGSAPSMEFDPFSLTPRQLDEILALVYAYFQKEITTTERDIDESLNRQDLFRHAVARIDAGFSPADDLMMTGTYYWRDSHNLISDPNSWPPTSSDSPSDGVQRAKRKWQAERLRDWAQGRITVEENQCRDLKKSLRALKTRAQDRYVWADVHTETVKTVSITPV